MTDSLNNSGPKISSKMPPPPKSIGERYDVLEVIGSGGAGVVYKVLDKSLNKIFAIKKLHGSSPDSQSVRFQREARILATLQHPNLLNAVDFGLTDASEPYLVLEYVPGRTMAAWLKDNGPMPVPLALATFTDIARGLAHAHNKNVIHRDLKPSNIMLIEEEEGKPTFKARILDFGLALDTDSQFFTKTGVGLGTPKYMPPEQASTRETDARSDIYSFGCLMFEALTATAPFEAETVLQIFDKHAKQKPDTISARAKQIGLVFNPPLTPGLEAIVDKCLQKKPQERFQTVADLLGELLKEELAFQSQQDTHKSHNQTSVMGESIAPERGRSEKQKLLLFLGTLAFLLVSLTVSYWIFFRDAGPIPAADESTDVSKIKMPTSSLSAIPEETESIQLSHPSIRNLPIDLYNDEDLERILQTHPDLPQLKLEDSEVTRRGLALLKGFHHLETLEVPYRNEEGFLESIAAIKSLRSLDFLAPDKPCVVTRIDQLKHLRILSLTFKGCDIEPDVFATLTTLPKLHKLSFSRCRGLAGRVIAPLAECKKLTYLSLNRCDITDESLKSLSKAHYEELKLTQADKITRAGVLYAAQMPYLQKFKMIDTTKDCKPALKLLQKRRAELNLPPLSELQTNVRETNVDDIELIN